VSRALRAKFAWVFFATAGCSRAPFATVAELPKPARRPDEVFDRDRVFPHAAASAPAQGVVSLLEPVDERVLRDAVEAFFAVFTGHDPEALEAVLSPASRLLGSHGASSYAVVHEELVRRVLAFKASNVTAIHVESVDGAAYGDFDEVGPRRRPSEMRPGDILAYVRLTVPRVDRERLFGEVIVLLFRPEEDAEQPGRSRFRVVGFDEGDAFR
jgi:hypothetical protein